MNMHAMASQTADNSTFYSTAYSDLFSNKDIIQYLHCRPFVTGELPSQTDSNTDIFFVSWRHHE